MSFEVIALLFSLLTGMGGLILVGLMKHARSDIHQTPKEREILAKAIEDQIRAHGELDNQRFETLEKILKEMREEQKEMRDDIRQLLTRRTRRTK